MKKLKASGIYDVTLLWKTEGIALGGSSGFHLWPLVFTLCEVPPPFRSHLICVTGVV